MLVALPSFALCSASADLSVTFLSCVAVFRDFDMYLVNNCCVSGLCNTNGVSLDAVYKTLVEVRSVIFCMMVTKIDSAIHAHTTCIEDCECVSQCDPVSRS